MFVPCLVENRSKLGVILLFSGGGEALGFFLFGSGFFFLAGWLVLLCFVF